MTSFEHLKQMELLHEFMSKPSEGADLSDLAVDEDESQTRM